MTLRRPHVFLFVVAAALASGLALRAQQPAPASAATAPLDSKIPTDTAITTGTFPNGLRYYIRHNATPENRASLRLVVNAGSVLEADDQQGLAHFVEHMAFNGTTHFPKMQIVDFMESIGMRFGPSVNAFTSFDETVYMLEVPTDQPAVLDRAMLILQDWAHDVTFDPEEIDKERGVIMEEWRLGRGASARMQDQQFPILFAGSRYATRLPIGKPDIIQHFTDDKLTRFYHDWYRPDLMAVIAVGDFDTAAVRKLVEAHFASIPAATNPRPRPVYDVPTHAGTSYAIATDKEATTTSVSVYNTMPARDETTVGAYRRSIVEGLFAGMLNARFSEMARKPDAPFLGASAGRGRLVRTAEASMLRAMVKDGGVAPGLEALFVEANRVAKFGFTASELERQKVALARSLERAVVEKDHEQSADLAAEYSRNFLQDEPIPGIVYENDLYTRFLPGITLDEVNALARTWSPDNGRVVMVNAPEKPGVPVPTQAALAAAITSAAHTPITAYTDRVTTQPLMPTLPTPGTIIATSTDEAAGITEWTLSNGVHVVLKPTTFKQDEIVFRAFAFGGTSLAPDDDFVPASTAGQVIAAGGLGQLSALDLRKLLTGKVASVRPSIGTYSEGLGGGGSPQDLETLFQRIHLTFTAPRADKELFDVMREQTKSALANRTAQPEFALQKALSAALTQDHPRARIMTPEMVDQMDLDKSLAFYRDRFSDASGFTFVFVGSFTPETLRPFVERYLASLPSTGRHETWKDVGIRNPDTVIEKRVDKGIEPKSQSRIVFVGPFEYDQTHRAVLRAMATVLEGRLRTTLREDLGGTYSVSVSPAYSKIPVSRYQVSIAFGSSPDRTDNLVDHVFQEIDKLKTEGPSPRDVSDTKEILIREFETGSKQNGYLLAQLVGRYENGEDIDSLFQVPRTYANITADDIQAAAREYLDTKRYVKVLLFPEQPGATGDGEAPAAGTAQRVAPGGAVASSASSPSDRPLSR